MFELSVDATDSSSVPWFKRLWAAVVRRAAVDWVLYKEHSDTRLRKIGSDAGNWIFGSTDDRNYFAFETVCNSLELCPSVVRRKIKSLREEDARKLRGMEFGDEW